MFGLVIKSIWILLVGSFAFAGKDQGKPLVCGLPAETLSAAAKRIDDVETSNELGTCLVNAFAHTALQRAITDRAGYVSILHWVRDTDAISPKTSILLFNELQKLWIEKYFSQIGNQSIIKDRLERIGNELKMGGAASTGATLIYLARKFKQEKSLIKVLMRGLSKRSALPLMAFIFSPWGDGQSLDAQDEDSALTAFLKRAPEPIPPSPAFVFLNDDIEELNLSYDEFLLLKDTTSAVGAAAGVVTYAFTRIGDKSDALIRLFLYRQSKALAARGGMAFKAVNWLRRSRKIVRFAPTAVAASIGEAIVGHTWQKWKDHSAMKKLEQDRMDFLSAVANLPKSAQPQLSTYFAAEIYLNSVTEFVRFTLEPFLAPLTESIGRYHAGRFCSSYRYLERRQLEQPAFIPQHGDLTSTYRRRYKVPINPEKEFAEVTKLNRDQFIERTVALNEEFQENIQLASEIMKLFKLDMTLLSANSPAEIFIKEHLQDRMRLMERMSLIQSLPAVQSEVLQRSEKIIGYQFDLKTRHRRHCPALQKDLEYQTPEDIWYCYKEIADELGCAPYFGLEL